MPVICSKDSKGCYARWGSGKKYYYKCGNTKARKEARHKAHLQEGMARKSGYKGK